MKTKADASRPHGRPGNPVLVRRDFLIGTGLASAGLLTTSCIGNTEISGDKSITTFGMVTDAHYADTNARGTRHYRESIGKLEECIQLMNRMHVDFMVELGDFKDQTEPSSEEQALRDLQEIEKAYACFNGPRYHVLGNHDMDCISKPQFMAKVKNTGITPGATYYSFDHANIHWIVLDANFTSTGSDYDCGRFQWNDANIPTHQLDWLEHDLASTDTPTIVFCHQQLDDNGDMTVRNAAQVRRVLEQSGKVLAVFQGHYHEGAHSHIQGIHYYTLKAMVDGSGAANSAYAVAEVYPDGSIVVSGYRKAVSSSLPRA